MSEQLAYMAGLMDGEGSWSIQVNIRKQNGVESVHFSPKLSMTLYHGTEVFDEMQEIFGGSIYSYPKGAKKWSLHSRKEVIRVAEDIHPYLRIKKQICERFLEALYIFPEKRANHRNGERSWTPEMTERVARIALTLNPGGTGRSKKTLDYLQNLDNIYRKEVYVDAIIKSSRGDET